MKIGILGGSFNPVHHGHLHLANLAINKLQLNQLWLIPTIYNPLKDKSIYLSIDDRILNCKNLTKNHPKIFVKKFSEIYTIELIEKLKNKYPNYQFYFIMGADNFENFHHWKNFSKIIKMISIAIFSRNNYLLKIRQSKAWHRYYQQKLVDKNRLENYSNDFKNNIFDNKIKFQKSFLNDFKSEYFIKKILQNSPNKLSNNLKNKLPKFQIFHTKNYNLSSTKIRHLKT
jgi:nicotinate-nucleotide adenylyltransferase